MAIFLRATRLAAESLKGRVVASLVRSEHLGACVAGAGPGSREIVSLGTGHSSTRLGYF